MGVQEDIPDSFGDLETEAICEHWRGLERKEILRENVEEMWGGVEKAKPLCVSLKAFCELLMN